MVTSDAGSKLHSRRIRIQARGKVVSCCCQNFGDDPSKSREQMQMKQFCLILQ